MMDLEALWDKARKQTEIHRMRLQDLATFEPTTVPYVFLAESAVNPGDTVVRKGQVQIARPAIYLPDFSPQFEGFELESGLHLDAASLATFLLVRGIHFPSLKYHHVSSTLDVAEQSLQKTVDQHVQRLRHAEDVTTGLVVGPEDAWQFSIVLLVGALVVRSADGDLKRILDRWRKRQLPGA